MSELIINWYNIAVVVIGLIVTLWANARYNKTKSRPLLNSLPGVFTSLGLLGTFISICLSLHGLGVNTPEIVDNTGKTLAEVQASGSQELDIMKIINKLIPAFTSSIVGLIGALIVSIWAKFKFSKEDAEDNSKLNNNTPEYYIQQTASNTQELPAQKRLLDNLLQLLRNQEEKNREYNDRLNENISHQSEILREFIDGFVSRMDDIFQQMHGAIQRQVQTFGEEQFSKTSEVLTSITERLSAVSTEIIDTQRQSVETMMSNTNTEIGTIAASVTAVVGQLSNEIQGALSSLGTQQSERLNSIISNYDTLADRLSQQNVDFADRVSARLKEDYEKVQQHNVQSLEQMVSLRDAYQEATSEVMNKTLNMNETVTANLRDSMSGFVANIQSSITEQCTALSSAITTNVEALNKAYKFIESLVAEIRQNYDQSVLAYGDAVEIAHRTNESAEKTIAATNNSLQSVEQTNQKIGNVLNILTERQENIERLTRQISSMSSVIEQLQKMELTLNKIISK